MIEIQKPLWDSFNGKGFAAETSKYAERSSADANGNSLTLTITGDKVTAIGDIPIGGASGTYGTSTYTWPDVAPEFEYVLLQNFIDGHSIGTVTDGEWITTVLSAEDYSEQWMCDSTANVVDNTVGADLVDSRNPVDFSSLGVSSGTPYGMVTSDADNTGCYVIFDVNRSMDAPLTFEFWAFARSNSSSYTTYGSETLACLGNTWNSDTDNDAVNLAVAVITSNDEPAIGFGFGIGNNFFFDGDGVLAKLTGPALSELFAAEIEVNTWITTWHHFAICVDTSNLYFFIDGKKVLQKPLSDTVSVTDPWSEETITDTVIGMLGRLTTEIKIKGFNYNQAAFDGGFAQIAMCNSCKWTGDFTVPTVAY